MTKTQIKAELRRSACEDESPAGGVSQYAWDEQREWRDKDRHGLTKIYGDADACRTFFLLVAEAL